MNKSDPAMSHPPRVRGLKLAGFCKEFADIGVAPPAGAWIETRPVAGRHHRGQVAPPAGAWIETRIRGL